MIAALATIWPITLGSTRSLVGEDGAVTAAYDYWPYGKILVSSGTGATHFRFTGHERDAESGLDYMLDRNYAYNIGRFLRPDPMQDMYPGNSPYAYAANNPLKYVDPDGNKLRFAPGSSAEFRKHFASAVQYLNKHKVSGLLARLERSETVFYLAENPEIDESNSFNPNTKTISWNPIQGFITTSDKVLSPVIGLLHEADHANRFDRDREGYVEDTATISIAFKNKEEERVILGTETSVARKTGLIGPDEVTRRDHTHRLLYRTIGPTSTVPYSTQPTVEVVGEREQEPNP